MKASFLLFFLIAFSIYFIGNAYLFIRGWQALEIAGKQKIWFTFVFWIFASLFIITQVMRVRGASGGLFDTLSIIGSLWVAVLLYGFIAALSVDILRIIGWVGNIKPEFIYQNYPLSKAVLFGSVCLIISAVLVFGHLNAYRPRATHLEIPVAKHAGDLKNLRVVAVSDIHLGHVTGRKFLSRVIDKINEQNADIVLLVGDTFDGGPGAVIEKDSGIEFDRLKSKYGTFVVSGNHEYIGEREDPNAVKTAFDYLASHGVRALQDSMIFIDNAFYVVGRKDKQAGARKTVAELMASADKQYPVILLDHQPAQLDLAEEAGADLQLSGHTHHGQMWPLNYVTGKVYEQDWGYLKKGESHFYVSCGVGTWGPPVRTAGRSEVVVIDLKFED